MTLSPRRSIGACGAGSPASLKRDEYRHAPLPGTCTSTVTLLPGPGHVAVVAGAPLTLNVAPVTVHTSLIVTRSPALVHAWSAQLLPPGAGGQSAVAVRGRAA